MEEQKKSNSGKKVWIAAGLSLVIGLGAGFFIGKENGRDLPATSRNYNNNKVIATVGDVKIKEKELKQRMEPMFYMNGKTKMSDEELDYTEQNMIDYITTTEVLYQEGIKNKVKLEKDELKSQYEMLMASITQTFQMEEADFLKKFKLTKEEVEKSLEKEIIASKYIEQESEVTDKDVASYYNKNKDEFDQISASHILIQTVDANGEKLSEENLKQNKKLAEDILKKAKAGESFEELAKEYSEDGSAMNGGDLGFFNKGKMVPEFEKAAFGLKKGEIAPSIVETQFGYHIIKKTDEKTQSLDEIKETLKKQMIEEKQNAKIQELVKEYKVEVK